MKKPKIAVLVPRFGLVDRGVENFTKEFVSHLGKDFDITIFSRSGLKGQKVGCFPEDHWLLQLIYKLPRLKKLMGRYYLSPIEIEMLSFSIASLPKLLLGNFDLIFPQNGVWGALVCRLVRSIRGTKFVYRSAGGKEPMVAKQKPDVYVATTPEIEGWLKKFDSSLDVRLIANGVDLEKFKVQSAKLKVITQGLKLEKPIILCVGALIPQKRIELTIKAVAQLKIGSLLVLGQGPLQERLDALGKMLLKDRFLVKNVPYSQMPEFYTGSDVFTLPSKDEPFGIVYLEAKASGLPVVSPDDSTRRYILGSEGIYADIENPVKYATALKKAIKLGKRKSKQVERFSWQKIASEYEKLFSEVINAD